MLSKFGKEDDKWYKLYGLVEFAINTSLSEGRGTSPAELAHGEPLCSPLDAMVGNQLSGIEAGELSSRVQVLVQRAKEHIERACAYQKAYFDRSHRHDEFEIGDSVLLSTKNLHLTGSRKFQQRFTSPFQVV